MFIVFSGRIIARVFMEKLMSVFKNFSNKQKQLVCAVMSLLIVIIACITLIPDRYDNYNVDAKFDAALRADSMMMVSGVPESTVFPDAQPDISDINNDSDMPAFLTSGVNSSLNLSDSAERPHLMSSGVTLASNKVSVTSSALDHVIQRLSFDKNGGIQTVDGGTGRKIDGDLTALNELLRKSGMSVGFLAVRISDGAAIAYQPDKYFSSCSTVKAPYCLYVAKLISEGKLDPEKSVAYTASDYMTGSGSIKNFNYGTHFRIKTLVEYSISKSDNIAHNMLNSAIGSTGFYDMLSRINCDIPTTENLVWPEANATSAVLWWSQIYSFKDEGATGKWLWNLFNINYSKIAVALNGKDCRTKTGSSTYCSHETGVVLGDEPYIVAIYTKTSSAYGVSDSYFYSVAREIDKLIAG